VRGSGCNSPGLLGALSRWLGSNAVDGFDEPLGRSSPQAPVRHRRARRRDLVGSTALSAAMDPEDLRDVITSFQTRCTEAIRRYDGFVAKFMGDGILAYYGYPRAHEDEAERSARAGLDKSRPRRRRPSCQGPRAGRRY
jgi:class 3 adenylate cyclase